MRVKLIMMVCFALASGWSGAVLAHSQPGPSYLSVDGRLAETNPMAGSYPGVTQDIASGTLLLNQPVKLAVDLNLVNQPDSQFRWDFGDGSPPADGAEVSHTFAKAGSYQVTFKLRSQRTPGFLDFDTVKLDITPRPGYRLPTANVAIKTAGRSAQLEAAATVDQSAKVADYRWDLGDGTEEHGRRILHDFGPPPFSLYPLLRVTDSNGLYTDVPFELDASDSGIVARELPFAASALAAAAPVKTSQLPAVILGALVLLVPLAVIWRSAQGKRLGDDP